MVLKLLKIFYDAFLDTSVGKENPLGNTGTNERILIVFMCSDGSGATWKYVLKQ